MALISGGLLGLCALSLQVPVDDRALRRSELACSRMGAHLDKSDMGACLSEYQELTAAFEAWPQQPQQPLQPQPQASSPSGEFKQQRSSAAASSAPGAAVRRLERQRAVEAWRTSWQPAQAAPTPLSYFLPAF